MLRKLLKHEFRATARTMVPLFGIVAVLALGGNLSTRFLLEADSFVPNLLGGILIFAFVIGMVGLVIMSVVVMVNRFRTNLMGDEGYVMFTLPATSHQLVWSKIIVSTVWFLATVLVEFLCMFMFLFDMQVLQEIFSTQFFQGLWQLLQELIATYGLNLPVMGVELLLLALLSCAALCLQFYAAIATGHSFANHKMAFSILFFFGFQFALQFAAGMSIYLLDESQLYWWLYEMSLSMDGMGAFHSVIFMSIGYCIIPSAIFYGITATMLKRRLNLQ